MALTGDRKSYGQSCPLAMALDRIGDRWTMLIVRELLGGPARFTDLRVGLPGIASNLLSARLRRMEDDGLIRRSTTETSALYSLTPDGERLRTALEELGKWGRSMDRILGVKAVTTARSLAVPLQAVVRAVPAPHWVIELLVDDMPLEIATGTGASVIARVSIRPDATATSSIEAMSSYLMLGTLAPDTVVHRAGNGQATHDLRELLAQARR